MASATLLGWPPAGVVPKDNFNDNRRGSMWRLVTADDSNQLWLDESAALLNVRATGWMDLLSSCVGHWTMNDNAATTVVLDSSGNGQDGTAQQNTSVLHTTGQIDGALTFNGTSDYVNVGNVIGTGAYTKVAWVKRESGNTYNNIISSSNGAHALYAPYTESFRLSAGHVNPYKVVQDPCSLEVGVWYMVAVTFDAVNGSSGRMVLYKDGVKVSEANDVPTQLSSPSTYIGRFLSGLYFKGAIDNAMVFDKALTDEEIAALYNGGSGTETIPAGGEVSDQQSSYSANGWDLDVSYDFAAKVDYHYSEVSMNEGWIGMSIGDDSNYVSISAGSEGSASKFFYEAAVDGSSVVEEESRTSDDGTLYVSYDSASRRFYLSHTGFGSGNAYVWTAPNPTDGQWAQPVRVSLGGGAFGAVLSPGQAYMDNFEVTNGNLFGWPIVTDVNYDGYIDAYDLAVICENWLGSGDGDIDSSGTVDLFDLAELALGW
jgi:hypothetical protein